MLHARDRPQCTVRSQRRHRLAAIEAHPLTRGGGSGRHLRQPLRERLGPCLDRGVALKAGRLQRGIAGQGELI